LAGASGAVIAVLALGLLVVPARGDAPAELSVYSGRAIATPIGIVSKVPAESAGGVIYSEARLEIGKTRAIAAGMTLGELAEAFLITSVQGYTNPALVNAQYPPSNVYKSEDRFANGVSAGGASLLDIHAVADKTPSASADAVGGAGGIAGLLHIGGGESRSRSLVKDDGTVVTTAVSSVHNIGIGPPLAPILTIGTMTSSASVEVPFGGKPKSSLTVQMGGVLLAGTPVTITQDGITLGSTAAVPASGVQMVNQALAQLGQQGLSITAVPVEKQQTDTEATVSGAALRVAYKVPTQVALPTDIGKDETFLLGQVIANATGRKRQPLSAGSAPADVLPSTVSADVPTGAEPVATTPDLVPAATPPAALGGSTAPAATESAGPAPVQLPHRARNVVAERVLDGYRLIIVAAVIAAAAYLLRNRTRLQD
jgi:hypothetical protein